LTSFFIYYRVATRDWEEAEALVRSMQARLACRIGIAGRLLKKCEEPGLWMEIYESISQSVAFESQLAQVEAEFDITKFMDGPRNREVFNADPQPVIAC
jgi:hypothetical protein